MSHAIPEPFVWDKSFAVFYAKLDEEHKGLFQGIFACCEGNNGDNLASLKSKVNEHFVNEEAELKKVKNILYPLINLKYGFYVYSNVIFLHKYICCRVILCYLKKCVNLQIAGYDFAGHKAKHDDFLAKLGPLEAPLDAPTVNFAKDWLVNHIKNTDFTYKGKM